MKGFIEVNQKEEFTHNGSSHSITTKIYCHYSQIYFKYNSCYFMDKTLKETYDQVKQLIIEATEL